MLVVEADPEGQSLSGTLRRGALEGMGGAATVEFVDEVRGGIAVGKKVLWFRMGGTVEEGGGAAMAAGCF